MIATLLAVLVGSLPSEPASCDTVAMECCAAAVPCADCSCALGTAPDSPAANPVVSPTARDDGRAVAAVAVWTQPPLRLSSRPDEMPAALHGVALLLFLQTHAFLI